MENTFTGTFSGDVNKLTLSNDDFRKVIFTDNNQQLVLMSLLPGEDIGMEIHYNVTQFIRIEKGSGEAALNWGTGTRRVYLSDDSFLMIPAGTEHNIFNTSKTEKMKLYTIYSPPNHPSNRIDRYKPEDD